MANVSASVVSNAVTNLRNIYYCSPDTNAANVLYVKNLLKLCVSTASTPNYSVAAQVVYIVRAAVEGSEQDNPMDVISRAETIAKACGLTTTGITAAQAYAVSKWLHQVYNDVLCTDAERISDVTNLVNAVQAL